MTSLKEDEILACGTVRQNRKNLPKNHIPDKRIKKYDFEFRTSSDGIGWVKWKDSKMVYALSNFHDSSESFEVSRTQKDGCTKMVNCPTMIKDYNMHMGHVDKADMLKSLYKIDRK